MWWSSTKASSSDRMSQITRSASLPTAMVPLRRVQPVEPGRAGGREFDEAVHVETAAQHAFAHQQRQTGLDARHAVGDAVEGGLVAGHALAFGAGHAERCVVGRDDAEQSAGQGIPDVLLVGFVAWRRTADATRAMKRIAVIQSQVLRTEQHVLGAGLGKDRQAAPASPVDLFDRLAVQTRARGGSACPPVQPARSRGARPRAPPPSAVSLRGNEARSGLRRADVQSARRCSRCSLHESWSSHQAAARRPASR